MGYFCVARSNDIDELVNNAKSNIKLWEQTGDSRLTYEYLIHFAITDLERALEEMNKLHPEHDRTPKYKLFKSPENDYFVLAKLYFGTTEQPSILYSGSNYSFALIAYINDLKLPGLPTETIHTDDEFIPTREDFK